MKKVLISGYYGFGNSGDEAILKSMVKDFERLDPSIKITVLSKEPLKTNAQYGVKAVHRFNPIEILSAIKECDMLISGGGSLLQDVTSTRSLLYYLFIIKTALRYKKKVMLYANGIGPIVSDKNRRRVKSVLNRVDLITLREHGSYELLKEIGVNNPEIIITADPVLNLPQTSENDVEKIFRSEMIPSGIKLAGVNIRQWKGSENMEEEIARACEYIKERYDLYPLFIPMFKTDLEIIERVRRKIKGKSYSIGYKYNPEDIIGIMSKLKLVIAMRLHTLIYASINYVPMIGLVYDPKIKSYLDYVGQEAAGDVRNISWEDIMEKVDGIMADYDRNREMLQERMRILKLKAEENAQIALRLLNKQSR